MGSTWGIRGKGSEVNGAEQRSSWRDVTQGAGENGLMADMKTGLTSFEEEVHKTQKAEDKTPEDQKVGHKSKRKIHEN